MVRQYTQRTRAFHYAVHHDKAITRSPRSLTALRVVWRGARSRPAHVYSSADRTSADARRVAAARPLRKRWRSLRAVFQLLHTFCRRTEPVTVLPPPPHAHSRMMPGLRSSSQLAPSKLIAPSSPPCTAPPLALPVWPAWTASREREGGGKRLKATNPRNKRENGQKEWHESTQTSEADGRGLGEVC